MEHPARKHGYITTYSGQNVGNPISSFYSDQVEITDIARSLSMQCRFLGHLTKFYSVAEHSVMVSRMAQALGDDEAVIPALLHDAHEAYMGDMASPQKAMIGRGFKEFESAFEYTTRCAFLNMSFDDQSVWERVKQYDIALLHAELGAFRPRPLPDWYDPQVYASVPREALPVGLPWEEAEQLFLTECSDLKVTLRKSLTQGC